MMLIHTLLLMVLLVDPGDIARINAEKEKARQAYMTGDYETAVGRYRFLIDSANVQEEEVLMNLANSYFQLNDTTLATNSYQQLTQSKNMKLRSIANQQLGVLNNREGRFEEALQLLKQSLKADPTNDDARFNYEMIKKKLEEQKKQDQEKQQQQDKENKDKEEEQKDEQNKDSKDKQDKDKKDQQNKDQKQKEKSEEEKKKEQEQQQKEQQQKDEKKKSEEIPQSVKDKLKEMNMSEEKAKMILEAMKNQEVQYLQQNKRKAAKPKDKTKPDW